MGEDKPSPMSAVTVRHKRRAHFAWGPFLLTLILTVMVGWSIYQLFMREVPAGNQRILDMMTGNLIAAWLGALAYWFNTTFSSGQKTELLAKAGPVDPT